MKKAILLVLTILSNPEEMKTIKVEEFKYLDSKPTSVRIRVVDEDKIIAEGSI